MNEQDRARKWRESLELTQRELGDSLGWTREAICMFECNITSSGLEVSDWAWKRYKMACAGLDAQLKGDKKFNW
jgi:transcriptional regulator with XRE-family HTH domain